MSVLYDSTDLYENGSFTYDGYPLRSTTGAGLGGASSYFTARLMGEECPDGKWTAKDWTAPVETGA